MIGNDINMDQQISIDQMIACVEREIGMREKHYPRWVKQKKIPQTTADQELARMRAVRGLLIDVLAEQQARLL